MLHAYPKSVQSPPAPLDESIIALLDAIDSHLRTIEKAIETPATDAEVRQ